MITTNISFDNACGKSVMINVFNVYGLMPGAVPGSGVCITSYDYDAPLSEAGDITEKYLAIREAISKVLMQILLFWNFCYFGTLII